MAAQAGTQAVDRAAALLAIVVESHGGRTFTSLVDELGLAKSTTSRLLHALERHRLVQRDRVGAFRVGPLFAVYAAQHDSVEDLVEIAHPTLERLGEQTGETVNLAVPRGDAVVQVAQVDSQYLLGATNWVGVSIPAHCSALGKVFFAYGAMTIPDGELERRTEYSITSRSALQRELSAVARRGWAVAREELEPGLVALAAPVRARDGSVIAALSISGPTTRLDTARTAMVGALLNSEARRLSTQLGHEPGKEGVA